MVSTVDARGNKAKFSILAFSGICILDAKMTGEMVKNARPRSRLNPLNLLPSRQRNFYDRTAKILTQTGERHPEATIYFLQAQARVAAGDWQGAEQAALLAAQTPAMFPAVHRDAWYMASFCQAKQFLDGDQRKLEDLAISVRRRFELGHLKSLHAKHLTMFARKAGDLETAAQLNDIVLEEQPTNLDALLTRSKIELGLGNLHAAANYIQQSLEIQPGDTRALEVCDEIRRELESLAEQLQPGETETEGQ